MDRNEALALDAEISASESVPGSSSPVSPATMDRSLLDSVAWIAASDWLSQLFSWASFLVVMRLLSPADLGIAAMSVLILPYLALITAFGIPRTVVTLRDLTEYQLAQLNTVSFALSVGWFAFAVVIAKPFATFFNTPRLAPVLIVAATGLIVGGIQGVPAAVLAKEMRFRFLSVLGGITAVVASAVTLLLALTGFGYWALVLGNLVGWIFRAIVILRNRPCRLAWPNPDSIRYPLGFSWRIMVSMIASNSYQNIDNFVAAKTLGQTALGFYGTAWEFANVPVDKIATMVTTVLPTYLAAVQNDPGLLRRYFRTLTETIALATFPATVGLGLVAHEFVPLVFGHKWDGVIGPLEVLAFYAGFRSIVSLLPKFLVAMGNVSYAMWNDVAALILLPAAFYIGSRHGTLGIAWGWVLAYPLVAVPLYKKTLQTLGVAPREYFRALWPALEGTVTMIMAVQAVKYSMAPVRSLLLRLVVEVLVGIVVYLGVLRLRHKDRLQVLIGLVTSVWKGKSR